VLGRRGLGSAGTPPAGGGRPRPPCGPGRTRSAHGSVWPSVEPLRAALVGCQPGSAGPVRAQARPASTGGSASPVQTAGAVGAPADRGTPSTSARQPDRTARRVPVGADRWPTQNPVPRVGTGVLVSSWPVRSGCGAGLPRRSSDCNRGAAWGCRRRWADPTRPASVTAAVGSRAGSPDEREPGQNEPRPAQTSTAAQPRAEPHAAHGATGESADQHQAGQPARRSQTDQRPAGRSGPTAAFVVPSLDVSRVRRAVLWLDIP
jgi:hypothetical protein